MSGTDHFSVGAPCWADLWTSDIEGSRSFYSELFGWQAEEPSEEFGGYFMFTSDGAPIAGGMGDMGPDLPADNTWKIYLTTDDIAGATTAMEALGAQVAAPAMAVADLGFNMVFADPTGARLGAWQPGTFPGFTALNEPGAPSWFELFTGDFTGALDFYRSVFGWKTAIEGDTDEFRYATLRDPRHRCTAGRSDGCLDLSAGGRPGPLVDLLGGRRHRGLCHQGHRTRRLGRRRSDRHPLRLDGHGDRSFRGDVQAADAAGLIRTGRLVPMSPARRRRRACNAGAPAHPFPHLR